MSRRKEGRTGRRGLKPGMRVGPFIGERGNGNWR